MIDPIDNSAAELLALAHPSEIDAYELDSAGDVDSAFAYGATVYALPHPVTIDDDVIPPGVYYLSGNGHDGWATRYDSEADALARLSQVKADHAAWVASQPADD